MKIKFEEFLNEQFEFREYKNNSHYFGLEVGDWVKFVEPEQKGGWQGHEMKNRLMGMVGKIIFIKKGFANWPTCDEIGVQFLERILDNRYNYGGMGKPGYCKVLNGTWLKKINIEDVDDEDKEKILKYEEEEKIKKLKRIDFDPFGEEWN